MRNWTAEEDGHLLEMLRLGFNHAVIAKVLGRCDSDIRARMAVLKALEDCDSRWNAARAAGGVGRTPVRA